MGISANQARLLTLTARQHDLELRAQQISARKMALMHKSQSFALAFSNNLSLIQGQEVAQDTYIYETLTPYNSKYYTRRSEVLLHKDNSEDIANNRLQSLTDAEIRNYIDAGYLPCTVSYPSAPVQPSTPDPAPIGGGSINVQATNVNADAAIGGLTSTDIVNIMLSRNPNSNGNFEYAFTLVGVQERQGQLTGDGQKTYDVYIRDLRDRVTNQGWDAQYGVNLTIEGDTLDNYNKGAGRYYKGDENAYTENFTKKFLQDGTAYITASEITDYLGITSYADGSSNNTTVVTPDVNPSVQPDLEPVYTPVSLSDAIQGDVISVIPAQTTGDVPTYEEAKAEYDANMASLSSIEKMLDMELTQIDTEHKAVKTEYDAVKSLISDNVEKSFNVFG